MVTRRRVLRTGLITAGAVTGTAAALGPMLTAGQPGAGTTAVAESAQAPPADGKGGTLFDEVYRGRRIQGYDAAAPSGVEILVDGLPLEVMRRVDGSLISMANHYQPYMSPRDAARAAVDVIGLAPLAPSDAHHH